MTLLLKYKTDTNALLDRKRRKPRPVFHATMQNYEILKLFLDFTADKHNVLNQVNHYGETPLYLLASEEGKDNDMKVKLLIESGASCHVGEKNPLNAAVSKKNFKVMRILYRQGDANPNPSAEGEKSPIELAITQNDHSLLKELLHWKDL